MENEKIVYIMKFMKREHIKTLKEGHAFYANLAGYYWGLEEGQGDKDEAIASAGPLEPTTCGIQVVKMVKGAENPIFCCYAVKENSVVGNGRIKIDKQMLQVFNDDDNVALLFKFEDFLSAVNSCDAVKCHGLVKYYDKYTKEMEWSVMTSAEDALLFKHKRFKYQNEYRIVFDDHVKGSLKLNSDGSVEYVFDNNLGRTYSFKKGLNTIRVCEIEDFEVFGNVAMLKR